MPADDIWLPPLRDATEPDGVRVLEHRRTNPTTSQFLLSTTPAVAPQQIIRSVKGRLQYLVRQQLPQAFRRNYSLRSVGSVTRAVLEKYLEGQTERHPLADARSQQMLEGYQLDNPDVDLSRPRRSGHGEYLCNLHLVLVRAGRWREVEEEVLSAVRSMIVKAAAKKNHLLARGRILADHIHLELGCGLGEAPMEVGLGYLNNLAFVQGMRPVYQFGFYVGTFGEYDLGAIRQALR